MEGNDQISKNNILFEYEGVLFIGGELFRPDFIIRKANGEQVVWEHFGMMDNEEYAKAAAKEIAKYLATGFEIGRNLIITSESQGNVLDITLAEEFANLLLQEL